MNAVENLQPTGRRHKAGMYRYGLPGGADSWLAGLCCRMSERCHPDFLRWGEKA